MSISTNESYKKYVIDDLKSRKGLAHPVKSPLISRIKPKVVRTGELHPNPEDEFSMESIGPNWEIVSGYEQSVIFPPRKAKELFDSPLIVTRLDKGGYMLLNGHHRWMACINQNIPKVLVKVVNVIQDEDVCKTISKSKRHKCITMDFDEVLLLGELNKAGTSIESGKATFPFSLVYKENIRNNASLLIREFQNMGYDVWVYTGSYLSEQYIKGLFFMNHCHVDGVVNGINGKKNSNGLRDVFREKYDAILHVDNEAVTYVNTKTKKYEIEDINASSDEWAAAVVDLVRKFDVSKLG